MDTLLKKFLKNKDMKKLYEEANSGSEEARKMINKQFNNFLYEIHFLSYISKTISLSYKEIYRKVSSQKDKELYILNKENLETGTELIDSIIDKTSYFEEEIHRTSNTKELSDYFDDPSIIKAINQLTERQKLVIFKQIIEDKSLYQIAKELGVTKQTISKVRKAALATLKKTLGGEKCGRAD
ncbi:sigma factor-like helix-turn-helix DNA-binding protein [Lutispora saccharofermentans]|uniref:Sigma-70 family RNA polymerase sigma factor n=1 Tax=Lutispora saccharofermentans TaxID=3024236 RepID=A0ABT1NHN8_9FIRM|nr:sigma-70 family RNA polymerase sigma factor [Lutispora saccharofermentans]